METKVKEKNECNTVGCKTNIKMKKRTKKNVKGKNNTEIKGAKKKTISKMKHISNRNSKCL